jgi:hypothetical protein
MKKCSKCEIVKELNDYPKIGNRCKLCLSEYRKKYKQDNKEAIKEKNKLYYEENKERILEYSKKFHSENKEHYIEYRKNNKESIRKNHDKYKEKNKEKLKEYNQNYREKNKEKLKEYKTTYYLENKDEISEKNKLYYKENKDEIKINRKKYDKEYREKNKEIIIIRNNKWKNKNPDYFNTYVKERFKVDEMFKLSMIIRNSINTTFRYKGFKKSSKTSQILGCSFEEFKLYLESKFEDWMTWENRGLYNGELNCGWDIDHIIPISSAKTEEEAIRLNHYTNLQPLCSKVNRDIKKDKY